MISQALFQAIESAGQGQLEQLRENTKAQVGEILAEAQETAEKQRKAAYQDTLQPLRAERAQRLHQAQMEAVAITAAARDVIANRLLPQINARLKSISSQPDYPDIFQRLLEEALQMLGEREINGRRGQSAGRPSLEIDARDEVLARDILQQLGIQMNINPTLSSLGGVIVQSSDGRIIVTNTLESRLEQLKPHLNQFIPENDRL